MTALENLNQISQYLNSPVRKTEQYRVDSDGLREHIQSGLCVIVGFAMLDYLQNYSVDYRKNKRLSDFLYFNCGSYFQCPVFTAYTVPPNDFLVIYEDYVDRIIFNRFP